MDLGIRAEAPLRDRAYMAYVRVAMRTPRPDGLSSQEEFAELSRMEDQLAAVLTAENAALFVGRNTSGGHRDFYFYVHDPTDWARRVSAVFTSFPHYQHEAGSRLDREWTTYLEFLYPSGPDMERIQNRRVCESLRAQGDSLTKAREIDHWAYFPDEESRARFLASIAELGFEVRSLSRSEGDERPFCIQFFRADLPSHEAIDSVTLPLYQAAREAGGDYDGWETPVVTES